ncbi:MAG: hypothetical protein A2135_12020 [Actinobacteria bacterium RBG_16_67_15]|nr:MAG: hypothetical protein A2135_12020 [Actinobacteria bacterium RBG_16_67_15]
MHELALAAEIVEVAVRAAGDSRVVSAVQVSVDPASHVDGARLADAFEIAAAGTSVAGARLEVAAEAGNGLVAVTSVDVVDAAPA